MKLLTSNLHFPLIYPFPCKLRISLIRSRIYFPILMFGWPNDFFWQMGDRWIFPMFKDFGVGWTEEHWVQNETKCTQSVFHPATQCYICIPLYIIDVNYIFLHIYLHIQKYVSIYLRRGLKYTCDKVHHLTFLLS